FEGAPCSPTKRDTTGFLERKREGQQQTVDRINVRIVIDQSLLNRSYDLSCWQGAHRRDCRMNGVQRQSPRPNQTICKVAVDVHPTRFGKHGDSMAFISGL